MNRGQFLKKIKPKGVPIKMPQLGIPALQKECILLVKVANYFINQSKILFGDGF